MKRILKPLDERVVIKSVEMKEEMSGGIILPVDAQEKIYLGVIVAVGDDITRENEHCRPLSELVKIGDAVVFTRYGGSQVKIDDEEFLVLGRNDLLAKIVAVEE